MKRKLLMYSFAAYALSVLWVLLFPLVSITTSELKPRGLYVDENALVVEAMRSAHRDVPHKPPVIDSSSQAQQSQSQQFTNMHELCALLVLEGVSRCRTAHEGVTEIVIDAAGEWYISDLKEGYSSSWLGPQMALSASLYSPGLALLSILYSVPYHITTIPYTH